MFSFQSFSDFGSVQAAINASRDTGLPVFGTPGLYTLTSALTLPKKAQIICLPGCEFEWNFNPTAGIINCPADTSGARLGRFWRGGQFKPSASTAGDIFVVDGDMVTIEGILIPNIRNGVAIRIKGNRCSVINPTITGGTGSIGVAVESGSGFRMLDGLIDVATDSLQLITNGTSSSAITDAQIQGISLKSSNGSLMEIASEAKSIEDVIISGITGKGGAPNRASIRLRNISTIATVALRNIVLRDAMIEHSTAATSAVIISNVATGTQCPLTGVTFDNVTIRFAGTQTSPKTVVTITGTTGARIDGFSWLSGGIQGSGDGAYLTLQHVDDSSFSGVEFSGTTNTSPLTIGVNGQCDNVAFSDSYLFAPNAVPAVSFDYARHCGWTRGAIVGQATSAANGAAKFTAYSIGCYIEGADLSGSGTSDDTKIGVSEAPTTRLRNNIGSTQVSGISFGVATAIGVTSGTIGPVAPPATYVVPSSHLLVDEASGMSISTISGGRKGFVLTLRSSTPRSVNELGNIRLAATPRSLAGPNDTLTLMFDGANWLELAYSANT